MKRRNAARKRRNEMRGHVAFMVWTRRCRYRMRHLDGGETRRRLAPYSFSIREQLVIGIPT